MVQKQIKECSLTVTPFFISASKCRKKYGQIKRGDCIVEFDEDVFYIKQGDEIIKNNVDSIYCFDIWDYKDDTYFKIQMKSKTEYKFKSIYFDADKISEYIRKYDIEIEDNR